MRMPGRNEEAKERGFSMAELIVVAALITIIAGIFVGGIDGFARSRSYQADVSKIENALHNARSDAVFSVDNDNHTVYFGANDVLKFAGDTYAVGGDNQLIFTNSSNRYVKSTFSDTGSQVTFTRLTGTTTATGTIYVIDRILNATTTLTISTTGVVQ